jgi:CysZ protein
MSLTVLAVVITPFLLTPKLADYFTAWLGNGSENWYSFFHIISYGIVMVGLFFFIYFFFVGLASIISIPFMDFLSSKIESELGEPDDAPFWVAFRRGILSTLLVMLRMLMVLCVSLPLFLIPVVGSILYFLINAWYFAYGYLDYPMGRKGWSFKEKKQFMIFHKREQLILGSFIYAFSLVPLLNLFVIPLATAAATLLFIKIEKYHDSIESSMDPLNKVALG